MIMDVLLYGVSGLPLNLFNIYCWHKLVDRKINFKNYNFYLALLIILTAGTILNYTVISIVKMVVTTLLFILICRYIFGMTFKQSIMVVLVSQIIVMVAELVFVIICSLITYGHLEEFLFGYNMSIVLNIVVPIISLLILKLCLYKNLIKPFQTLITIINKKEVILYSSMIIVILVVATTETYMELSLPIVLTINTVMALVFIFIIFKFAITENKYAKTNDKYQVSITSLREYQEILDKYRISTHENKNQLLAIKNMSKDSKIISYINAIIDDKTKDNDAVMNKAYKIPDDRFRSTIYPKMCKIDELKIKYKFLISNDVKTADLIDMDDYLVRDACMILGVYLDNAIEAVKDLNKKLIYLEIYIMDGYLCFDITNNFEGTLDVEKLFKRKYTTKGKEHGYGLVLVNRIVKENDKIENECEVSGNIITQRLKVKM